MKNSQLGFSLIELIITLSICSLLITIAMANWHNFFASQLQADETNRIFHSLQFARLEAIKQNRVVSLCGTQNFMDCQENWAQGFIIFIHQPSKLKILRQEQFSKKSSITSGNLKVIRFAKDGRCLTRGTITVKNAHKFSKIILYDSGRIRVQMHP